MTFSPKVLSLLTLPLFAPLATAQRANTGPLAHAATTYFLKSGSEDSSGSPVDVRQLLTKKAGRRAGTTQPPTGPNRPDFRFPAMFQDPNEADGIARIEIDAFSVGLDLLWVDPALADGRISDPTGDWLAVAFSVESSTLGATPTVQLEQFEPEGAGADVFDYVSELSLLPARYLGNTSKTLDSNDLNLASPSSLSEITALDFHVPLYALDSAFANQLPATPRIYFSITGATAGSAPGTWWFTPSGTPVNRSGAVIFMSQWSRGSGWSLPSVFCEPGDLDLDDSDEIDALAVDRTYENSSFNAVHFVYSTTGFPTVQPSELMFASKSTDPRLTSLVTGQGSGAGVATTNPYKENDGMLVESKAGTGSKVDSVCVLDPFIRQDPSRVFSWGTPGTTPLANLPNVDESLWAASYRSCVPGAGSPPVPQLEFWLSGFGVQGPNAGTAVCLVAFTPPAGGPTYIPISVQTRDPFAPGGDPLSATLRAPVLSALQFAPIWSLWFTLDPGFPRVQISNSSLIQF